MYMYFCIYLCTCVRVCIRTSSDKDAFSTEKIGYMMQINVDTYIS